MIDYFSTNVVKKMEGSPKLVMEGSPKLVMPRISFHRKFVPSNKQKKL